jgi:DEAD/DEAH box helicase domain-containing protein
MKKVVFDIETSNIFADVGKNDPALLNLSVIGIYESETDKYSTFLQEELKNLWPILEKADLLIGYNSLHFDLPLLNKYYSGDLSKIQHIDLLKEIRDVYGRRMKLDQVAEGTLNTKKSGHGLQAITWWKNGEIEKVKSYCLDDVKITKEIYEYALANKKIKFTEGGTVIEVPLKTDGWETKKDSGVTFTLPF